MCGSDFMHSSQQVLDSLPWMIYTQDSAGFRRAAGQNDGKEHRAGLCPTSGERRPCEPGMSSLLCLTTCAYLSTSCGTAGRVYSKRVQGKLVFYDVRADGAKVQVMADVATSGGDLAAFVALHNSVKIGDIIGVEGFPGTGH